MDTQHEHLDAALTNEPVGGHPPEQHQEARQPAERVGTGWRHRLPALLMLLGFLFIGLASCIPEQPEPQRLVSIGPASCTPEQLELQRLVNVEREAAGLPTLLLSSHATAKAQAWAETLAGDGNLRHSKLSTGMPADFFQLGENVGRGPDLGLIHDAFMRSPSHRANVLDPEYQWLGTGTARSADGVLYVAVVFALY